MKKIISFLFVGFLLFSLAPSVFADEVGDSPSDLGELPSSDAPSPDSPSPDVTVDQSINNFYLDADGAELSGEYVIDDIQLYSVSPITPSNSNGLKAIILSLIGNYDPVIVEYRYLNNSSTSYGYLREVQPDYPWLCSLAIFLIVVYSVFRLGGAYLGRN